MATVCSRHTVRWFLRGPYRRGEGVMPTGIAPTNDTSTQMIRSEQAVVDVNPETGS